MRVYQALQKILCVLTFDNYWYRQQLFPLVSTSIATLRWKFQHTANSQYSQILGLPFHLLAKVCCNHKISAFPNSFVVEGRVASILSHWACMCPVEIEHGNTLPSGFNSHTINNVIHFFFHFYCLTVTPDMGLKSSEPRRLWCVVQKKKIQTMSYIILVQLWVMVHAIQCQQIKNIFIKLALYKQGYILTGW